MDAIHGDQTMLKNALEELMREKSFNPRSLSLSAGLGATAVRDILEDRVKSPRGNTIIALAEALNVDPSALLEGQSYVNVPMGGAKTAIGVMGCMWGISHFVVDRWDISHIAFAHSVWRPCE